MVKLIYDFKQGRDTVNGGVQFVIQFLIPRMQRLEHRFIKVLTPEPTTVHSLLSAQRFFHRLCSL
jgi:hypothetical protein